MIKVLNLYAGIGGNRKLWPDDKIEVTAVEFDPKIAAIYKDFFPGDTVIVGDAHQYLLEHYKEFDFIWASPPCPTHSSFRQNICVRFRGTEPVYPDMKLWQEILFLQANAKCRWVVENVKPYYTPLIKETAFIQRHMFWSNYDITDIKIDSDKIRTAQIPQLQEKTGFNLSGHKISNKRQVLRNCVDSKLGKHIFDCAFKNVQDRLF